MGLTITRLRGKDAKALSKTPNQSWHLVSVNFDSSYPTGGEAFDTLYDQPIVAVLHVYGGKYVYEWNPATGKILALKADDKLDTAADGRLIEESNMTNLSAETGIIFAVLVDHS